MVQLRFSLILCLLLHSFVFLDSVALAAVDDASLFPNQKLVDGKKTLVSQNQVFEMGFFSPGKSSNRFMGVWYKSTPEVVVWVANRNNPISQEQAPVLMISRNGSLVIGSENGIIWSVESSRVARNPVLRLLDSGNLVVVDDSAKEEGYLWESFDYPTDTFLPGMSIVDDVEAGVERYLTSWKNPDDPSPGDFIVKIHNHGLPDVVLLRGKTKRHRQGQWNGVYFGGSTRFPSSIFKPKMVFKQERLISLHDPYQSSLITRISIDSSGTIVRHHLNARRDKWNLAFAFPRDSCDEYATCGPNSMCRSDMPVISLMLESFLMLIVRRTSISAYHFPN